MSLSEIKTAQDNLEEAFTRRMAELEAQLNTSGQAKDTVAKVAEEFRTFRELMFGMLGLLRKQISECCQAVDHLETRQRQNSLIFLGVPETDGEDCRAVLMETVHRMELPGISAANFSACHRIGVPGTNHHRPILVWFSSVDQRGAVWRAKTKLRGTAVSVKEFLTRPRQLIFGKARVHFGMRNCWTQDGVIVVKTPDSLRHKVTTIEAFNLLVSKFPKTTNSSSNMDMTGLAGAGVGASGANLNKARR